MSNFNACDYITEWTNSTALVRVMGCGFYGDVVMAGLMCDKTEKQPHRNLGKVLLADAYGSISFTESIK